MALLTDGNGSNEASVVNGALKVVAATVERSQEFTAAFTVQPSTLTAATVYAAIRNSNTSRKMRIKRIVILSGFSGAVANSFSLFGLRKFTGSYSGGVFAPVVNLSEQALVSGVGIRYADTSLTPTDVSASAPIAMPGSSNIQYGGAQTTLEYDNFILGVNEGLQFQAESAIVAGQRMSFSITWEEFE